jgi:phosphoribosylformylglycinamidine synthase
MKFGVVIFPGSNCDHDLIYVLRDILGKEVEELWHKDKDLKGVDFIMVPGNMTTPNFIVMH